MVKIILLDIDDTLLDFTQSAKIAMRLAFEDFGITYQDGYFDSFLNLNRQLWQKVDKGIISKDIVYGNRWNDLFADFGIKNIDGHKFEKSFFEHISDTAVVIDGAFELLDRLKGNYKLYVASNAPTKQQYRRLKKCGMYRYFDGFFLSDEVGHSKPSKEYFDICFEKFTNISKEDVLMIGDSISSDIEGAKNYGLKTCWVKKERHQADIPLSDITVSSLSEITIDVINKL